MHQEDGGYEPCAEDEAEQLEESSSEDEAGHKKHREERDIMKALDKQMRQYQTVDDSKMDSLDVEQSLKYQFKASFISHLCAIKERKDEYKQRLKTFNKKKSTKGSLLNQQYLEKQIYE